MFKTMTVRWALIMMGGIATVLALVPFVAFFYGPAIRARSKYSRLLMEQEREALETERLQREVRGLPLQGTEDLEGYANEESMEQVKSKEGVRNKEDV